MRVAAQVATRANVLVETRDARTGRCLHRSRRHNLVVDAGLDVLRDLLYGDTAHITHGAVGTDGGDSVAADETLRTEVFRDTIAQRAKTTHALTVRFVVGSQGANGYTLREAGLFNDATAGDMYARVTPDAVVKTDAILVIYTWTLSFEVVSS